MKKEYSRVVEEQKGPIRADVPTMKSMSEREMTMQDYQDRVLRRDGQTLKYHEPKK